MLTTRLGAAAIVALVTPSTMLERSIRPSLPSGRAEKGPPEPVTKQRRVYSRELFGRYPRPTPEVVRPAPYQQPGRVAEPKAVESDVSNINQGRRSAMDCSPPLPSEAIAMPKRATGNVRKNT